MGNTEVNHGEPSGKIQNSIDIPALEIQPSTIKNAPWVLPPSKSHLIRMLYLCALSNKEHTLLGFNQLGDDAESMRQCLTRLGTTFEQIDDGMKIVGRGMRRFEPTADVLNAGNSGTSLRFLIGLCSRLDFTNTLDGDSSLRNRHHSDLLDALVGVGVKVSATTSEGTLPITLNGPWQDNKLRVDVSRSSQPFSSLLLSTSDLQEPMTVETIGESVSRRHAELTLKLMQESGAKFLIENNKTTIQAWSSNPPKEWHVPPDASMMAFPILACSLTQQSITIQNPVFPDDALGHEILMTHLSAFGIQDLDGVLTHNNDVQYVDIDLRDANDLLPPLAAILALSGGGRLRGAQHAKYKESNRINSTATLLKSFGLSCKVENDGLSIEGNQRLKKPTEPIRTSDDHRIQMTAVLLATKTGGVVEGPNLHQIADPMFLNRLSSMPSEVLVKRVQ